MAKFILWHYSEGFRNFLKIWGNYFEFFWNFFSIGRFFRTLLSPWRRDVSRVMQRGFHPVLFFQALVENIITRILGAIIKSVMILVGVFFEILAFLFGIFVVVFWLGAPLALLAGLSAGTTLLAMGGSLTIVFAYWSIFFFGLFVVLISFILWKSELKDYFSMELQELSKEKWFERVWNRVGKEKREIDESILKDGTKLGEFLRSLNLTHEDFSNVITWAIWNQVEKMKKKKFWLRENLMSKRPIGLEWAYAYTVNLDRHSRDLSEGDYSEYRDAQLIGRDNQLKELKRILLRSNQNNALIIGEAGVGRSTIIHTLAKEIRENRGVGTLTQKRILDLDVQDIMSKNQTLEKEEAALEKLFNEAAYAGNIILVLKNIHEYLDSEGKNIAHIISKFLPLATFQIIATTNPDDFHSKIDKKGSLMKYCEKIMVEEMNQEDALAVMLYKLKRIEEKQIVFTYQSLKEIIKLADRYVTNVPFPEKSLDLMEEVLLHWQNSASERFIASKIVNEVVSAKFNVPLGDVEEQESDKLLNLEKRLHERVIGQKFAILQIAEAMRRARVGMVKKDKPLGSFLFLGPTGVGKTESAKALAEAYFGDEKRMVRLDMSEYQMQQSINRLIGSVESKKEGYLVSKVKENPHSLLLLDEIEKAHPDILNLFLQVLDEGHLTDAFGKKVSFKNLIIIATSNAGADIIKECIGQKMKSEEIQKKVMDFAVKNGIFRPEFLNRFEGVIFFHSLSEEESQMVTTLLLNKYAQSLKKEKNITLTFGPGVAEKISQKAYDPVFGARAIDRFIQDKVGDKIVKKIIAKEIEKGGDYIFQETEIEENLS